MNTFIGKRIAFINAAIGGLVGLANGGALLITVLGGTSHMGGEVIDMTVWTLVGVALALTSIVGIRQPATLDRVLFAQAGFVAILAVSLAIDATNFLLRYRVPTAATIWIPGFLSIVSAYSYWVLRASSANSRPSAAVKMAGLLIVTICVGLDIATSIMLLSR